MVLLQDHYGGESSKHATVAAAKKAMKKLAVQYEDCCSTFTVVDENHDEIHFTSVEYWSVEER
jgi:hypothetical protein